MVATHRTKTPELVTGNPLGDRWNACVVLLSAVSGFVVIGVNGEECCFGFRPKPSKVMEVSGYADDRPDQSEEKSGYRFVPSLS